MQRISKRFAVFMAAMFFGPTAILFAADPPLEQARKLYNVAKFEESLAVLRSSPSKAAATYALTGRNYYMLGDFKRATEALEKAVAADPGNAEYSLWLARAYGRRAETSMPLTAPAYASKARRCFEAAVQLDQRNMEALSDLLEYYLDAPGFLGGGLDKAARVAVRISALDPAEGHVAQARLAEKRKEYGGAEAHLVRAIETAPQRVGLYIDLARFLTRHGRQHEAEQSLARAEQLAPNNAEVLFAKAELYIKSGRNTRAARELLKRYMSAELTPDDPPREDAARLLREVGN